MRGRFTAHRLAAGAVLVVLWILLQGEFSVPNLVAGLAVVAVVFAVVPPARSAAATPKVIGIVKFTATVLWSLVTSSVTVMIATLFPTPQRTTGSFLDVTLADATPLSMTLVANAISVTPGTITLEATLDDDGTAHLSIHVFGTVDAGEFRSDLDALHALACGTFRRRTATAALQGGAS